MTRRVGSQEIGFCQKQQDVPFDVFVNNLPQTILQCDVIRLFGGLKKTEKDTLEIADRLIRCLQSNKSGTQRDAFVTLVILLTSNKHVKIESILELIDKILVTDGNNTKGERRVVFAARIMVLGAIVRSQRLQSFPPQLFNRILMELISLGDKRTSLLTLSTPFISEFLAKLQPRQRKKLDLTSLEALLLKPAKNQGTVCRFKISLTVARYQYPMVIPVLHSMESVSATVLGVVRHSDSECLRNLFEYLVESKQSGTFWKKFSSGLGPYHFNLLNAAILAAIEVKTPLQDILLRKVVMPLVGLLRGSLGDAESAEKATKIFRYLLDWDPKTTKMSSKDRAKAIRIIFEEANLITEYRVLHPVFRRFLSFLDLEELDQVWAICEPRMTPECRSGNSTINFVTRLATVRNVSIETKLSIAKKFFGIGFSKEANQTLSVSDGDSEISPDILVLQKKLSGEGFETILKSTFETNFFKKLFSYVKSVAMGKVDGVSLEKPASDQDINNLKLITKLLQKMDDEVLKTCLRIYGVFTIVDTSFANTSLNILVPLCEKRLSVDGSERAVELTNFILSVIREDRIPFNYELMFGRLLLDKTVQADAVQLLIDLIDVDMDDMDADEEDEDDDASSIEEEDESELVSKLNPIGNGFQKFKNGNVAEGTESDEESIDMDEASEGELEQMDAVLSNVFSTKKRLKKESEMEIKVTIRGLNLIEMLLRRYRVMSDGAIPLMLVSPCLTLLLKASKGKRPDLEARVKDVVSKLNRTKKVMNADSFERTLVQNVLTDVEEILEKKHRKHIRTLIRGTVGMLHKCFLKDEKKMDSLTKSKKRQSQKAPDSLTKSKKRQSQEAPDSLTRSKKRQLRKAPDKVRSKRLRIE